MPGAAAATAELKLVVFGPLRDALAKARAVCEQHDGISVHLAVQVDGVVASVADRVMVMYGGDVVESAPVAAFFARPTHPYSEALLRAMPRVDRSAQDLAPIPGQVPTLPDMPAGCRFQSRCPLRVDRCADRPPLAELPDAPGHAVRCWVRAAP